MNMKKVMLFAYDGTGLGHLMRLIKIAWGLSKECQVIVVSGHKAMPDIIPEDINTIFFQISASYEKQTVTPMSKLTESE